MKRYYYKIFFFAVLAFSITQAQDTRQPNEPFGRYHPPGLYRPMMYGDTVLPYLSNEARQLLPPDFERLPEREKEAALHSLPPSLRREADRINLAHNNPPGGGPLLHVAPQSQPEPFNPNKADFWQQSNGPYGGDIRSILSTMNNNILIGTGEHGIFCSTNTGENWFKTYSGNISIYGIIDDSVGNIFAWGNQGILHSTDNGQSWAENSLKNYPRTVTINSLAHIFVFSDQLFRSTDHGETWESIDTSFSQSDYVRSAAIDSNGYIFAVSYGNMSRSTNNGENWITVDSSLGNVVNLVINPSNNYMFVSLLADTAGVLRSTDGGYHWTKVLNRPYVAPLVIDQNGSVFAGTWSIFGGRVYRSTDNGANWLQLGDQISNNGLQSLGINPITGILAGTEGEGIFYLNEEHSWIPLNTGITALNVYSLVADSNGNIFAATDGGGIFSSTNHGESWAQSNEGIGGYLFYYSLAIGQNGYMYAGGFDGIYRSTNDGVNWAYAGGNYYNYHIVINSDGNIFCGTYEYGIYRSTDNGVSWSQINNGLPSTSIPTITTTLEGHLLAGVSVNSGNCIFRSTDSGDLWLPIETFPYHNIEVLTVNLQGHIFAGNYYGIFRSTDDGNSWISVGLSDITSIFINPLGIIFACGPPSWLEQNGYVYRSKDNGDNWEQITSGFPSHILTLTMETNGHLLLGGSEGVWRSTFSTITHISGSKFNDVNNNTIWDYNETGLSGWKIYLNGNATDSTMTDGSGNYKFFNLEPGTYSIYEEDRIGWSQSLPDSSDNYSLILADGDSAIGQNFGNFQPSSISGVKFNDLDGDGVKDGGEPGLPNWKIRLSGAKVDSVLTDANGNYSFTNLSAGSYTVSEDVQGGWIRTKPSSPGTYSLSITSGSDLTGKDFGNFQLGGISGKKFEDVADDSSIAGDPTMNEWVIKLYKSGVFQSRIVTSGNGDYSFVDLTVGTYTVEESLGVGWKQTFPRIGSYGVVTTTYGASAGGRSYQVTISSGSGVTNRDFGNFQLGSISGVKFNDLDGDGVKDGGEPGLPNWKIRLSGAKVDSVLTDANGNYSFTNLSAGSYTVSEDVQGGWIRTKPSSPGTYSLSITSGSDLTGKDFGNFQLGSISGVKFNDLNHNGIKDAGEPVLSGWTINLSGAESHSTVTDIDGHYKFDSFAAGIYTVTEVVKPGWKQSKPVAGSYIDTVSSGSQFTNQDFGNYLIGTIYGVKFNDLDGDGAKDAGEPLLQDWRIRLFKNGAQIDSTVTTLSGYRFNNLDSGTYTVREKNQSGWVQSFPPVGHHVIVLGIGDTLTGRNKDFGNFIPASISGLKFFDIDGNRVRDHDEPGLPGWKIRLAGQRVDSTLTDSLGVFHFQNLPAGSYTISEQQQVGWLRTVPDLPGTYTVNLPAARDTGGFVFGNYSLGQISGFKFNDRNGNGKLDANEPGLSGWEIHLIGPKNDSTLTNANDVYTFLGLPSGTYTVSEELQSGWVQTMPDSPKTYSVVMVTSGNFPNKNFGNMRLSAIRGVVFSDFNQNGTRDSGEIANQGMKIRLSGAGADSTFTDSTGNYGFSYLMPGLYTLTEEPRPSCSQSYPPAPGSYTITILGDTIVKGCNFGNQGDCSGIAILCSMIGGWNMISVPVIIQDQRVASLFPNAISDAFAYEGSYTPVETLKNGSGYWLKLLNDTTLEFFGLTPETCSIQVNKGWNMIGSISSPVSVGTIGSLPEEIVTSDFFGYNGFTYVVAKTIEPGHAYWVRVSSDGGLILSQSVSASSSTRIRIVSDGELPPPPPQGGERTAARALPTEFALEQNYPNPFNPTTEIRYQLPEASWVNLKVYNTLGQEVAVLVDEIQGAGYKSVEWDARKLPSGIYIYKINAGTYLSVKKMLLLK